MLDGYLQEHLGISLLELYIVSWRFTSWLHGWCITCLWSPFMLILVVNLLVNESLKPCLEMLDDSWYDVNSCKYEVLVFWLNVFEQMWITFFLDDMNSNGLYKMCRWKLEWLLFMILLLGITIYYFIKNPFKNGVCYFTLNLKSWTKKKNLTKFKNRKWFCDHVAMKQLWGRLPHHKGCRV